MNNRKPATRTRGAMLAAAALLTATPAAAQLTETADGLELATSTDRVSITFCGPDLVHVVARPRDRAESGLARPWVRKACAAVKPRISRAAATGDGAGAQAPGAAGAAAAAPPVFAEAGGVKLQISEANGNIVFIAPDGTKLLGEVGNDPRQYRTAAADPGLLDVELLFHPILRQGIYGLGQHQSGLMNYQGSVVELAQSNTDIAIPFMVSTAGYGLFWNSAAASRFDNRFPTELKISAEGTDGIDYYFAYGPDMDRLVGTYRDLTGQVPLFPRWAYGLFQSMDHYADAKQLEGAVALNRDAGAPMDVIVQDWRWWQRMGDKDFKTAEYPDVPAMLKRLADRNVRTMISIWPLLSTSSHQYAETKAAGQLVPGTQLYDPTSKQAADRYWQSLAGPLLEQGWDAFWLDGSEPELHLPTMARTDRTIQQRQLAIGPGAFYSNYFPFAHTANVHDRWRQARDDKRVFILSRSSFAGVQAHGAASWSGDIANAFPTFEKQIAGGLNFALSGMPYWTTDIGGYYLGVLDSPPKGPDTRDPAFQELYTRWFQYGVFNPLFRTHGKRSNGENGIASYGPLQPTLLAFDRLRYRLLPYIYSLAWQVTDANGTIMRPLVMDWRTDENVWNIADQFLFGPAMLVNPITKAGARTRTLYLPKAGWTDFWTGEHHAGSRWINADAPIERIPLYVRDGSILPLGAAVEHAGQDPFGPTELRVYRGADGAFTLYEDAGDGMGYTRGERSTVPIRWNEATATLTIGARQGSWKGAPKRRDFRVVFVAPGQGVGIDAGSGGQMVDYRGGRIVVKP
ncbi:TIM-barrel domain-containing protein [Sphingomonas sanxanigenens]|uniref:DUF5110 domain-containing protein n=1 Tax=Sphingomonas sanxanigenens DSM 19645 = NX02 TaxID=1123269 RepID=W0ACT2_9SPHN|nr:TIM-barrel domain-containing protein [Sphingomonas sanxanigenens]AHE55709.1 hypothetical protein NX02_20260 [Sphingomonas sanxanigenens DSM 19645 = NX02]